MFLFKFFGLLDVGVAVLLFLASYRVAPFHLLLGGAFYLIAKGIIFKGDVMSVIDVGIGVYCALAILFPIKAVGFVLGIYLFLKGFYSMVA